MKKQQYLDDLRKNLEKFRVPDVEDIILEYAQHFDFKIADGYSEDEIAVKLGNVKEIAMQYAEGSVKESIKPFGGKPLVYMGLGIADIGTGIFFIIFAAWTFILGALALTVLFASGLMLTGINIEQLIPPMPYISSFFFALPMLALTILSAVGTLYCYLYMKQLCKAYTRWHSNVVALVKQKPILPTLSKYPQLTPKSKRLMRSVFSISFIIFGITIIIAYAVAIIKTGEFEFWHAWNWFM